MIRTNACTNGNLNPCNPKLYLLCIVCVGRAHTGAARRQFDQQLLSGYNSENTQTHNVLINFWMYYYAELVYLNHRGLMCDITNCKMLGIYRQVYISRTFAFLFWNSIVWRPKVFPHVEHFVIGACSPLSTIGFSLVTQCVSSPPPTAQ